jgi:hypothetical protein
MVATFVFVIVCVMVIVFIFLVRVVEQTLLGRSLNGSRSVSMSMSVSLDQVNFGLDLNLMLFRMTVLMLLENSRINSVLKSACEVVVIQSVGQSGLGFLESLVSMCVVEDLAPDLRDLVLLSLRKSSLNGLLGGVGQMLKDVTSEVQIEDVRSDVAGVGSRVSGGLGRSLLLGMGLRVEFLNVVEVLNALVGEVLVLDEVLLFGSELG